MLKGDNDVIVIDYDVNDVIVIEYDVIVIEYDVIVIEYSCDSLPLTNNMVVAWVVPSGKVALHM